MADLIPGVDVVIQRSQWEQPGLEINNATYTPPSMDWAQVRFGMAHYTAASNLPDGDPGESPEDVIRLIQRIQASYLASNGYSIGYLDAVDWLGRVIRLRGDEYRPAANNGDKGEWEHTNLNKITAPVLFLVDGADRLTPAMAKSGRALYRHYHRLTVAAGGSWSQTSPKPHSETDYTSCCGDGIRADIADGLLDINYVETPVLPPIQPPPLTREDEIMMFMKHPNDPHLFAVDVRHIDGPTRDQLKAVGVTERADDMTDTQLAAFKRLTGRTGQ